MIKKKLSKLIGLTKEEFDFFIQSNQIQLQSARLIPLLKTGDEMALTSIFLSSLKLVKEYRDSIFKEIKLSRSGKIYYFTEVSFPGIDKSRFDGLIIVIKSNKIQDACFFEMKSKNNIIDDQQLEAYLSISKRLGVTKVVTVSNEFVADSSHSPTKVRCPKSINLLHFSWTYLMTKGQLLLFKNENIIEDDDQVEIMREVLYYFENPISGISGYTRMKPGWKQLVDNIRAQKAIKISEDYVGDVVLSWYEEEKDMALMLSRKLGVLVKSSTKNSNSLKLDIKRVAKENYLLGTLSVKNSVSDIKIKAEFERRSVLMSVKVLPPLDKGSIAKVTWMSKQLENCKKNSEDVFNKISNYIWIDADIKYARTNLKVKLSELEELKELSKGNEIQAFHIIISDGFGANFGSTKKFIELIEKMVLSYYEGIVQHITNWNRPAPKIHN